MGDEGSIWVGELEVDAEGAVAPVSGPVRSGYATARVLIRLHGAPIGNVHLPLHPADSLTARARQAAETDLAEALQRHRSRDAARRRADQRPGRPASGVPAATSRATPRASA